MGDLSGNAMYQAAIIRTHMRACSYSVGLVLGWAVHRWQIDGNDRTLPLVSKHEEKRLSSRIDCDLHSYG